MLYVFPQRDMPLSPDCREQRILNVGVLMLRSDNVIEYNMSFLSYVLQERKMEPQVLIPFL